VVLEKQIISHVQDSYLNKYGIALKIKSSHALGGGCINQALRLDTNEGLLFLKWNNSGPKDLFVREAESLKELMKSNNEFIIFPKPLLSKLIDHLPGYLLTTYLDSGMCGDDEEKMGRGLAQLHRVTSDRFGFKHDNYCGATRQDNTFKHDWLSFYTENRIAYIIALISKTRGWSKGDFEISDLFLQFVPSLLRHQPQTSLIHGDLWAGNYMYTPTAPALIDPCVSYCDREFEMGIMTMFGGFSQRFYDAYDESYPRLPGWKERLPVYRLYPVLNHYFLFGGSYKNQALGIMRSFIAI
jgi:fructosamine-3-kinase